MRLDCDQDAVWIRVEQSGAACHTGRRSCFYRKVDAGEGGARLSFVDADRLFDPPRSIARTIAAVPVAMQRRALNSLNPTLTISAAGL